MSITVMAIILRFFKLMTVPAATVLRPTRRELIILKSDYSPHRSSTTPARHPPRRSINVSFATVNTPWLVFFFVPYFFTDRQWLCRGFGNPWNFFIDERMFPNLIILISYLAHDLRKYHRTFPELTSSEYEFCKYGDSCPRNIKYH